MTPDGSDPPIGTALGAVIGRAVIAPRYAAAGGARAAVARRVGAAASGRWAAAATTAAPLG